MRTHRAELIDGKIAEHGGRIVKTVGDGLLLEFPSVVNATQCCIEVQQDMVARNEEIEADRRIIFRMGINLDDIIIEGEDIHGNGVNVAARLQETAEPGGITRAMPAKTKGSSIRPTLQGHTAFSCNIAWYFPATEW